MGATFAARRGQGWLIYAAVMLGTVGTFNIIDGIVALSRSKFYVAGAKFVVSDLRTWGWVALTIGAVEVFAALYVMRGSSFARWFGIAAASVNAVGQLIWLSAYPLWSLAAFAMDVLVVYALYVYGGAKARLADS